MIKKGPTCDLPNDLRHHGSLLKQVGPKTRMIRQFIKNRCLTDVTELQLQTLANRLKAPKVQVPGQKSGKSVILGGIIKEEFPDLPDDELFSMLESFTGKKLTLLLPVFLEM